MAKNAAAARAAILFAAYVAGGDATHHYPLNDFTADLNATGVQISLATLKRYSKNFSWQERAAQTWANREAERLPERQRAALAAERRRNRVGQALLGAGGRALQALLEDNARVQAMRPTDIARLLDLGMRADGQSATAIQTVGEINAQIWNDVVVSVVRIFVEINSDRSAEMRAVQFAERLDELVTERLRAVSEGGEP